VLRPGAGPWVGGRCGGGTSAGGRTPLIPAGLTWRAGPGAKGARCASSRGWFHAQNVSIWAGYGNRVPGTLGTLPGYGPNVANEALRRALTEHGMKPADLADKLGMDPKTIYRWVTNEGRAPHQRTRWAVAEELGVDEMELWPEAVRGAVKVGADREVHRVYPTHASLPDSLWRRLMSTAKTEITLCGYAPYWLMWQIPQVTQVLQQRAAAGCRIRAVIGDPDSPLVAADEVATGARLTLTTRIEETLHLLAPVRDAIDVRQSTMGFGRSVYRFDDELLADMWLHGAPGAEFPVLHLHRRQDAGMFDQLVRHVEALWEAATPV
jgi:hypothetical protein